MSAIMPAGPLTYLLLRWNTLQPNTSCKHDNLENSNIEKLSILNQQLGKILPYVWFIAPMTFYVLFTLKNS
jgi:hypothetical protein